MSDDQRAFPTYYSPYDGFDYEGMSLRDWFAGQALVGICSISGPDFSLSPEDEASWAYQRADAMMAFRKAQETDR